MESQCVWFTFYRVPQVCNSAVPKKKPKCIHQTEEGMVSVFKCRLLQLGCDAETAGCEQHRGQANVKCLPNGCHPTATVLIFVCVLSDYCQKHPCVSSVHHYVDSSAIHGDYEGTFTAVNILWMKTKCVKRDCKGRFNNVSFIFTFVCLCLIFASHFS